MDDLIQQFGACDASAIEVKRHATERWYGIFAEYLLVVDRDNRHLLRHGYAFGHTRRKRLVSNWIVGRENTAWLR